MNLEKLYECAGIVAGDGTIYSTSSGTVVMEIRGGKDEFEYYHQTVKPLFSEVLDAEIEVIKRGYTGGFCYGIRKCGRKVKQIFCERLGFPIGRKENCVSVPAEILNTTQTNLKAAYIRGVFDTDGSVYLRSTPKRKYFHPVVEITSVSSRALRQLKSMLKELGFNAWIEQNRRVRLGGWSTVKRFFEVVRPHNPKHILRYQKIILSRSAGIA